MSEDSHSTKSRARARDSIAAEAADVVEERVQVCLRLMPHAWKRGETAVRLAAEHGEDLGVWEHASAEAWRRHKAQDAKWVREYLAGVLAKAVEEANTIDDLRQRISAVVEVAKAWAPLVGANAPERIDATLRLAPDLQPLAQKLESGDAGAAEEAARELALRWMRTLDVEGRRWVMGQLGEIEVKAEP